MSRDFGALEGELAKLLAWTSESLVGAAAGCTGLEGLENEVWLGSKEWLVNPKSERPGIGCGAVLPMQDWYE